MSQLETDLEKAASHFSGAVTTVPFYYGGRILMPGFQQPALAVPLDGDYVVARNLDRSPYQWLLNRMNARIDHYRAFANEISRLADFSDVGSKDVDGIRPYLPNGYFGFSDALTLTTMLVTRNPKRYIEIGCGNSTRFARRAIEKYKLRTTITCIDPSPRRSVNDVADEVLPYSVLDVPISTFSVLEQNDILMCDGSHLVFHGTDTTHIFLRIMPSLKSGVIIHFHDIFLPFDYPERCDRLYWNEQYILAALFLNKDTDNIIAPVQFMHQNGLCLEGASFWFQN